MHAKPDNSVVALVCRDVKSFEFGIATEVFGLPRPEFEAWYRFTVASADDGPLAMTGGTRMLADAGLDAVAEAGLVVVPGWPSDRTDADVTAALRACVARGGRILAICSGTFPVAAAGLLDGRRATTHWRYAHALQTAHPRVDVDIDAIWVDEGHVVTSAGSAAGIDAALHVVREDWGPAVAATVARRLVVTPFRDGGQSQFVSPQMEDPDDGWLAGLLAWALVNLGDDLSNDALAARAHVSPRTLDRRFRAELGTSPGRWVLDRRLDAARELLASTTQSVEEVALAVGFGTTAALRHHFRERLGTSPTSYRRRFADGPRIVHEARAQH